MIVAAALGVDIGLDVRDAELATQLASVLATLRVDRAADVVLDVRGHGSEADPFEVWLGDANQAIYPRWEGIVSFLVHLVNRTATERTPLLAVHAGAVSFDGAGLLLPGVPEAGKSTLTAGLVQAGWRYLTDEAAAFAPGSMLVLPYPKPLSLSRTSLSALGLPLPVDRGEDRLVLPDEVRPDAIGEPCPVRWVVFPRYRAGADTELTPLSGGAAVLELAGQTYRFAEERAAKLRQLAAVSEGATSWRLESGDLATSVDALRSLA